MIKVIFWDFDGVIMESNDVRDLGFKRVLADFPKDQVKGLLDFHKVNGGLSRYVKFRHFFENIRKENITEQEILEWAERFSKIMKKLLVNENLLIQETLEFIKNNQDKYTMHITSGSDQEELRYLCKAMHIEELFKSIHGSPKPKKDWVKELIHQEQYNPNECILIGDSLNDWDAANSNDIYFMGYNANRAVMDKTNFKLNI